MKSKTFMFVGESPNLTLGDKEEWVKFTIKALLSHFCRDTSSEVSVLCDEEDSIGALVAAETAHLNHHKGNVRLGGTRAFLAARADGVVVVRDPGTELDEAALAEAYPGKQVLVVSASDEKVFTL